MQIILGNRKNILLFIPFLIILTTSGCYNKSSEKSSEVSPTQTITINTKVLLSTPSEITLQSSPATTYSPTSTPLQTPSNTKEKPIATKNVKSLPKKTNTETIKSLPKETNTVSAKNTPTPLKTPLVTNKTPAITCDGDVCRIITD